MAEYAVFKFRKVDKYLLQSLVNSEVYFAVPEQLNDPFDCQVGILRSLENAIARAQSPVRARLERLRAMGSFFSQVQSDLEKIGVCSFSLELRNSLMWAHYAENHRGVCLTYSLPESFFYERVDQILGIDQVAYGDSPLSDWFLEVAHDIDSFSDFGQSLVKKALTVKAQAWCYEREVRVLRRVKGVEEISRPYLKQVCFGLKTPESDVALVRRVIDRGGYVATLCKVIRTSDGDFSIDAKEI
jgi:DUF2971 family protein